jgi:hypothetical protein
MIPVAGCGPGHVRTEHGGPRTNVQAGRGYPRAMGNLSRSWWLLAALTACGGEDAGLEPPTCEPDGVLRYIHDLDGAEVTGELPKGSYVFVNKLSDDDPGWLEVGDLGGKDGGDRVRVEFETLLPHGDTVAATGFFKVGGREAGNCEMTLSSRIHALTDEGWTMTLVDLHAPPYCDGPGVAGSFAACLIPEPF